MMLSTSKQLQVLWLCGSRAIYCDMYIKNLHDVMMFMIELLQMLRLRCPRAAYCDMWNKEVHDVMELTN